MKMIVYSDGHGCLISIIKCMRCCWLLFSQTASI